MRRAAVGGRNGIGAMSDVSDKTAAVSFGAASTAGGGVRQNISCSRKDFEMCLFAHINDVFLFRFKYNTVVLCLLLHFKTLKNSRLLNLFLNLFLSEK